ncbi:FAD-dependent oxidoreductase [Arthrobacter crystallopoietes]
MELQADVVVVGLGGWGTNALWRLAKRGVSVIGIEARSTAHDQGSSHGITRLFRVACREHPLLGPVGLHALGLWDELGAATRTEQLTTTGALMVGTYNSETIQGSLAAAEAAGIKTELLAHDELRTRFPQYGNLDPDDVGLLDPFGGLNYPERAVEAATRQAVELGARVLTGAPVRAINDDRGGVTIETDADVIRAEHVIVSAGCWAPGLLPELSDVLQPRRMPMFWFRPAADPDNLRSRSSRPSSGTSPAARASGVTAPAPATPSRSACGTTAPTSRTANRIPSTAPSPATGTGSSSPASSPKPSPAWNPSPLQPRCAWSRIPSTASSSSAASTRAHASSSPAATLATASSTPRPSANSPPR